MLFKFIKYTRPSWQFNLIPDVTSCAPSCFITEQDCPPDYLDLRYQTMEARLQDAAYRLWNEGVLLQSKKNDINRESSNITLADEYIFLRKYWGKQWALFAFILRILSLKNPFKEIRAYYTTRQIERIQLHETISQHKDYFSFSSKLVAQQPKVAVIIPTLNRYDYLADALRDLEKQTYKNFEVIIVDQSDNPVPGFYDQFHLRIFIIYQKEKLLWTARNKAVHSTDAPYLLFFDDDSRVEPDWIGEHLKCLDFFNAQISAGVSYAVAGQKISSSYRLFRWADQFDSGNAMIAREVMKQIGMFDEQFNRQRMGDGEFAYRAYMHGIRSISNPNASRIHLKVGTGGLRELGSWDGYRTTKWFAPKPMPSVIYLYKKYLPQTLYLHTVLLGIMLSNVPYKYKRSSKMLFVSVILTLIKSPLLYVQYLRSHKIANHMLAQKTKTEILHG